MAADLTAYVPRLLLEWDASQPNVRYRSIEGTLVFADVSGFTKLSERLATKSGKAGAEELAEVINYLFGELLMLAARRGGEMLKYGGDAMLLFFMGEQHAIRGAAACADMQQRLRQIGRIDTGGAGVVRLRMSVGAHSGSFDFFVGGGSHRELVIAGPATSVTVAMEAAANATEVLMSSAMAALLPLRNVAESRGGGYLLRGHPKAPFVDPVQLECERDGSANLAAGLVRHLASGTAEPEHRLATVSFLQFLDLDRLLHSGRPDEAAARVHDVLTLVQEAYEKYGVTFLATDLAADGGKVMAAAGAPFAHEDDEERMLRASRDILDASPALPVRIGVHRGHVFAGNVGPSFRRTYTTLGDVTNTAARVMGRAVGGQCLVLEPVLRASRSHWNAERLEPFIAKGKAEPLVPWTVGRPGKQRTRTSVTPLVGRARELAVLLAELECSTEAVRTVDVTGEPGLGKSRLVGELAVIARGQGRPVVMVGCDSFTSMTPYRTVSIITMATLGPLDVEQLSALVQARAPALVEELPLVGIALGVELPPTSATKQLDVSVLPARIAAAAGTFLAELLPPEAVVIVEDAHWVDETSIPVLQALRESRNGAGVLLCVTRRASAGGWAPVDPDALLTLAPLDAESTLELVEAASPAPMLPDDARRLAERAAGNPLFIEQLARGGAAGDLPETVEELMATRIDELPAEARNTLRRLSVLGRSFAEELVSAVTEDVPAALDEFLVRDGTALHFSHALLQQAAYSGLAFKRRRELHRRVASHLMNQVEEAPADALAIHCEAGGLWPEAWAAAGSAARGAETQYAFGIAAAQWQRAANVGLAASVAPVERAAAWLSCGEAHRRAGQLPEAERAFRAGRKTAPTDAPEGIALAAAIGRSLLFQGRIKQAARWVNRAHRELAIVICPSSIRASVGELRAEIARQSGRDREVLVLGRSLVATAAELGDLPAQARGQSFVHLASSTLGLPEAEREGMLARDLAERTGDLRMLVSVLANLGETAERRSKWTDASELFSQASHAADRGGFTLGRAIIDNNVAEILVHQGRLDEALPLFERSRRTAIAAGHWNAAYIDANIGWVHGLCGDFELAASTFDAAERRLLDLGMRAVVPEVDRRRVAVAVVQGLPEVTLSLLRGVMRVESASDPMLLSARSHASRQRRDHGDALAAAVAARQSADSTGNTYGRLLAAEALTRLGDETERPMVVSCTQTLGIVARPVVP